MPTRAGALLEPLLGPVRRATSQVRNRVDLGGRVSRRWEALPRLARGGVLALVAVACYLLPLVKVPILDTPGSDFPSVLF
jgi:hypothetical protein